METIDMIYIPEKEYRKLLKESEILHKTLKSIAERNKNKDNNELKRDNNVIEKCD
jgi:hypothetical protein